MKKLMAGVWSKSFQTGEWGLLIRHTQQVEPGDRVKVMVVKKNGDLDLLPAEVTSRPFRSKYKNGEIIPKKGWAFFARPLNLEDLLPDNLSEKQIDTRLERLDEKWHEELSRLEDRNSEGRAITIPMENEKVLRKQRKR